MHDLAFADAARPTPVRVLGLTLRDYSIGHEILLFRERNALLGFKPSEFNQLPAVHQLFFLKRAALICSRDWRTNCRAARGLYREPNLWLWNWAIRWELHDIPLNIAEFRNYLNAAANVLPALSSKIPEDSETYQMANGGEDLGGGRTLGSPLIAQLILFLCRLPAGQQLLEPGDHPVYDFPFTLAANLYFTSLEMDGDLHIENANEADVRAQMAKHREDVKREKAEAASEPEKEEN